SRLRPPCRHSKPPIWRSSRRHRTHATTTSRSRESSSGQPSSTWSDCAKSTQSKASWKRFGRRSKMNTRTPRQEIIAIAPIRMRLQSWTASQPIDSCADAWRAAPANSLRYKSGRYLDGLSAQAYRRLEAEVQRLADRPDDGGKILAVFENWNGRGKNSENA